MILKLVYNTVACTIDAKQSIPLMNLNKSNLKSKKLMQTSVSVFQVSSSITGNQHLFVH